MTSPYVTSFVQNGNQEKNMVTRQELTTFQWQNGRLFKIVTIRQFFKGGSDYVDTQTVVPLHGE